MSNHRATAYGLVFDSDIALPELLVAPDGAPADITIRIGVVPEHLADPAGSGVLYEASADQFLLKMPDVANYLVTDGTTIVIEPSPVADDNDVRVFMLGSCFGALLHQREILVLHAAAMETAHGAVLFCGNSGAGKSTLLNEMLRRGHNMLVDDVCAVVAGADGGVDVVPGYPRTRLWADSAKKLKIDTDGLDRTRQSMEKFERQLPEAFSSTRQRFHKLYVLGQRNEPGIEIEVLPKMQSFSVILNNTYRRQFVEGLAMQKPHFALASAASASVEVARVRRPSGEFTLTELADAIEADLASGPASAPNDPEVAVD